MALQDAILQEVQAGRLQPHWTTSDLLANQNLSRCHPLTTLRTSPPNVSASLPGLNLGDGHNVTDQPVFYRVGRRGRVLLFALPEHRAVSQQAKPATPAPSVAENKRPKNPGKSDRQEQPNNEWSVESEHVSGFIDWLVDNEKSKGFQFSYNLKKNKLDAKSIHGAAQQYRWPSDPIPTQLVAHLIDFPLKGASNLHDTVGLLGFLRKELRDSLCKNDPLRHLKACWATLYWGGVANEGNLSFYGLRYISECDGAPGGLIAYHKAAHELDDEKAPGWFDPRGTNEAKLSEHVEDMSAGITKIHSLLADELVIYDSRVACAVAWLVERYCDKKEWSKVPDELLFSLPAPRKSDMTERNPAKVRPKKSKLTTTYQNPGSSEERKKTVWPRDKLRVSLILSEVLTRLGTEERRDSFLKYQLGLFMIGYHLGDHRV